MKNVIPVIFLAIGGYLLYSTGMEGDINYWIKVAGCFGGAGFLLVSNNIGLVKDYIAKRREIKKPDDLLPTDMEYRDNECLIHLRSRIAGAPDKVMREEGFKNLIALNEILFKLPEPKYNETSTNISN
jgi:hypothetical protein